MDDADDDGKSSGFGGSDDDGSKSVASAVLQKRSKELHGDSIVCASGKYRFYRVTVLNSKNKPLTCALCLKKSNDPSPLITSNNEDLFGGYHPWVYKMVAGLLLRRAYGQVCLICLNVYRRKARWGCVFQFCRYIRQCV